MISYSTSVAIITSIALGALSIYNHSSDIQRKAKETGRIWRLNYFALGGILGFAYMPFVILDGRTALSQVLDPYQIPVVLSLIVGLSVASRFAVHSALDPAKISGVTDDRPPNVDAERDDADVIIVGAGTAGSALTVSLARAGKKVVLVERDLSIPDRIVGELMQPGGLAALRELGLEACATEGIEAIHTHGYAVINPPADDKSGEAKELVLRYPKHFPSTASEYFGLVDSGEEDEEEEEETTAGGGSDNASKAPVKLQPKGLGFHNHLFVAKLRAEALKEPNVRLVHGTVTSLVDRAPAGGGVEGRVVGVEYKPLSQKAKEGGQNKQPEEGGKAEVQKQRLFAPLTVVADGMWSGLRKGVTTERPDQISTFVGMLLLHPANESPLPHRNHGHVFLTRPSPMLMYQVSPTETRVLVDFVGRPPSVADGSLAHTLLHQVLPQLPPCLHASFRAAVERGEFKSCPNRALPVRNAARPGVVLLGDALNMRHPLTGGGMTVALRDVVELGRVLKPLSRASLRDASVLGDAVVQFRAARLGNAATINVLANALYAVFSTGTGGGVGADVREGLRDACFKYLSKGSFYAAGPVGLLAAITPHPSILSTHFFMVALYAAKINLLPFPTPARIMKCHRIIRVACIIILPLLKDEQATVLSWYIIRKAAQLVFRWENTSLD